jgi:hypothetical protein
MSEARFIVHEGTRVLLMDFSSLSDAATIDRLADGAIALARSTNAQKSVLALMDLTGTRIGKQTIASLKRLSKHNGPYIRAMAFVGLNPLLRFVATIMLRSTKRTNHMTIGSRTDALDWLIQYEAQH